MFSFFPEKVSVITVVVLGKTRTGQIAPVQRFRLAKSQVDLRRFARRADGTPVLGPRVYRERTRAELVAAGLVGAPYLATLVPLGNTGEVPWINSGEPAAA